MNLVFFCHPPFMRSQSMPRFARMIGEAMRERGHHVEYWAPEDRCHRMLASTRFAKWAGYVDQYVIFPMQVRRRLRHGKPASLYVLCDQALGPWVPLVSHLPHVVHAHDLLALRSALGMIAENPTSYTGRIYQRYIRSGFRRAKHFISVSGRTRSDLEAFGGMHQAITSEVVYNGLNYPYSRMDRQEAVKLLNLAGVPSRERGHVLHIGGGQWYKNTAGVIRLYAHYASRHVKPLPLLMVSPQPTSADALSALAAVPSQGLVLFRQGLDNETVRAAYSLAQVFLFPSLAEGFGWPIIEAQACGCPVITSDDAPMSEIGGPLAHYLPVYRLGMDLDQWAMDGAAVMDDLLSSPAVFDVDFQSRRMAWAAQFTQQKAIDAYAAIYEAVLAAD